MRAVTALSALLVALSAAPASARLEERIAYGAPPPVSLFLPNHIQQSRNWCWAAVARQLIARHDGPDAPFQCELAARAKGVSAHACCLGSRACRGVADMDELKALLLSEGLGARRLRDWSPLALHAELVRGRLLVLGLREPDRPGHLVVAKGMRWIAGEPWFLINDPEGLRPREMSYRQLAAVWDAVLSVE